MGRLWQQLLLMKEDPIFSSVPVEVLVKEHQKDYYRVLGESDESGNSTSFIEFSLEIILESMADFSKIASKTKPDAFSRLHFAKSRLQKEWFNRKDYMNIQPDISTATASRDLSFGVNNNILDSMGQKNQMYYKFCE